MKLGAGANRQSPTSRSGELRSKLLTAQEAAEYLRLHPTTFYRMLKRQEIPAFKIGDEWRVRIDSLDQWIDKLMASKETSAEERQVWLAGQTQALRERRTEALDWEKLAETLEVCTPSTTLSGRRRGRRPRNGSAVSHDVKP